MKRQILILVLFMYLQGAYAVVIKGTPPLTIKNIMTALLESKLTKDPLIQVGNDINKEVSLHYVIPKDFELCLDPTKPMLEHKRADYMNAVKQTDEIQKDIFKSLIIKYIDDAYRKIVDLALSHYDSSQADKLSVIEGDKVLLDVKLDRAFDTGAIYQAEIPSVAFNDINSLYNSFTHTNPSGDQQLERVEPKVMQWRQFFDDNNTLNLPAEYDNSPMQKAAIEEAHAIALLYINDHY